MDRESSIYVSKKIPSFASPPKKTEKKEEGIQGISIALWIRPSHHPKRNPPLLLGIASRLAHPISHPAFRSLIDNKHGMFQAKACRAAACTHRSTRSPRDRRDNVSLLNWVTHILRVADPEQSTAGQSIQWEDGLKTDKVDLEPCRFRTWVCAKGTALRSCVYISSGGYLGEISSRFFFFLPNLLTVRRERQCQVNVIAGILSLVSTALTNSMSPPTDWSRSKFQHRFVPNPARYRCRLQPFPRWACTVTSKYTLELVKQSRSQLLMPSIIKENWGGSRGRLRLLRSLRLLMWRQPQLEECQFSALGFRIP